MFLVHWFGIPLYLYTNRRGLRHCLFCDKGNAKAKNSGISKKVVPALFYLYLVSKI